MNAKRGTIYFAELDGRIKIGFSNNVAQRIASLRTIHSSDLELIETMDGTFHLERAIHRYLAEHSAGREWFAACDGVYRTIAGLLQDGPAFIGYARPEKPKETAPDDPMIECVNKIARAVRLVFDGDMADIALSSPEGLALCLELAKEMSVAIERCKNAETERKRELIAAEFIGRCAARTLRGVAGPGDGREE
jgi:hypothetical protein